MTSATEAAKPIRVPRRSGRARSGTEAEERSPAQPIPLETAGAMTDEILKSKNQPSSPTIPAATQGAGAITAADTKQGSPRQNMGESPDGCSFAETQASCAVQKSAATARSSPKSETQQQGEAAVQSANDTQTSADCRFTNPLIAQIVETWRIRQDMVRAQQKLTLQIKSICRRYTKGDKKEADALYASMQNGMAHPLAQSCHMACVGLFAARVPLEEQRKGYEKTLAKLGKQLPIAHMADEIKGVNHGTLATIVGECGDLSAYRSVSAVWKRAGLAVIEGGRQRRVSGDAALEHGYSPSRRSTFWNISAALLKSQGKDDNAGPYRQIYDARKEYERPRVESDGHAHNRAQRHMLKELIKRLTLEWRRVAKERDPGHVLPGNRLPDAGIAQQHIGGQASEEAQKAIAADVSEVLE